MIKVGCSKCNKLIPFRSVEHMKDSPNYLMALEGYVCLCDSCYSTYDSVLRQIQKVYEDARRLNEANYFAKLDNLKKSLEEEPSCQKNK